MNLGDLKALEEFHAQCAVNQFALASRMHGESATTIRAEGSQHKKWAEQLSALRSALELAATILK